MKKFILAFAATATSLLAPTASVAAVTDCPLRDAPFSASSPLLDVLLNPAAKTILEKDAPVLLEKMANLRVGTKPPTFAAILNVKEAAKFTGVAPAQVEAVDAKLRALPVTDADRIARCARYDKDVPTFTLPAGKPRLLMFEKINGFRDGPSVDAAHTAFFAMAKRKGWTIVTTDKGGAFNAKTLRQFDTVIWNNVSGDVLSLTQRRAFQDYLQGGGGFVGVHGSAGDPVYFWDWYPDTLIGARFNGHPLSPQFQEARIAVNNSHPLASMLPREWKMTDEWYSFRTNPRQAGAQVLLTLDESTYNPVGQMGKDLRMGDHPLAWTNCLGKGRIFYSAIGHKPETYAEPHHVAMLEAAVDWTATMRGACPAKP